MLKKAKVREWDEARVDRWALLGVEVSHAPNPELFSWRCALIGIAFLAVFAVLIAISYGMADAEEFVVTMGLQLFAVGYALAYFLWSHFKYEGPMVRVVLSPTGLLYKDDSQVNLEPSLIYGARYLKRHFERIAYRHIHSASVVQGGMRNAVLVIRIEYEYPEGLVRTIEFAPAPKYKINEKGEHQLCSEIMRRVEEEQLRMQRGVLT